MLKIIPLLLFLIVALPGCAYLSKAEDAILDTIVKESIELCKKKYHRRLGYYTILAGELAEVGIEYGGIICPGDPETSGLNN